MLRKIVFSSLLILTMLDASSIESEIGINVGMNSTKNETGSKFDNLNVGMTLQYNNYVVMPRFDLEYVKLKDEKASSLIKGSVNAVYEIENKTYVTPYVLGGIGYENVQGGVKNEFESHAFVQGGVGLSVQLPQDYKVNLESRYLQILGGENEENEAIITAGVVIPLGSKKTVSVPRVIKPIVRPVIVKSSPKIIYANTNECSIKSSLPDFDRDGVEDRLDQCPATPCNYTVDTYGCPIKTTLKINFAVNSANINPDSISKVNRFAKFLLNNKGSIVKIVGHTDSVGSIENNLQLSQKRARSVVQSLVRQGVSPSRLTAIGKGESMPLASNKTDAGKAMNRRIEVELTYPQRRI